MLRKIRTRVGGWLVVIFMVFLVGCTATHGTKIEPEQIDEIKVGVTTETEIREKFGKPTLSQTDTNGYKMVQYAYGEAKSNKEGFIPYVGAFLGKTQSSYSTVAIEIDKQGLVKSVTVMEGEAESKSTVESVTGS
ncbi:MAG: hypothetical protein ACR2QG_04160 [Gammaproteobacteria bacterium]